MARPQGIFSVKSTSQDLWNMPFLDLVKFHYNSGLLSVGRFGFARVRYLGILGTLGSGDLKKGSGDLQKVI